MPLEEVLRTRLEDLNGIITRETYPKVKLPAICRADNWLSSTEDEHIEPLLEGFCDVGDKVAIIGASKVRKSFFCLQLALCLAVGVPFVGMAARKSRVLLANTEIHPAHFKNRIKRMLCAEPFKDVNQPALLNNLHVWNLRNFDVSVEYDQIAEQVELLKPEVLILDPLYRFVRGDENVSTDLKHTLISEFSKLMRINNSALFYTHHDPKSVGDRDDVSRGSGSSVLGRDYDGAQILSKHLSEDDGVVASYVVRNYRPIPPLTVKFNGNLFEPTDLPPDRAYSRQRNSQVSQERLEVAINGGIEEIRRRLESSTSLPTTFLDQYLQNPVISGRAAKRCRVDIEVRVGAQLIPGIGLRAGRGNAKEFFLSTV